MAASVAAASADGVYQRTKDGRTLVWNGDPKPGDAAAWSGHRDGDGYATGFGTLTWYTTRQSGGEPNETVFAAFFGNMIRGKLDGPVNGHSKGVTNHAIFTQGKRMTRWAGGPVPSWRVPDDVPELEAETVRVAKAEQSKPGQFYPPPPSYQPKPLPRPAPDYNALHQPGGKQTEDIPAEGPGGSPQTSRTLPGHKISARNKPKIEIDESLRSLTGPPPSLGMISPAKRSSKDTADGPYGARFAKEDAIGVADAAARNKGYDIDQYQRSDPQFDEIDRTWSVRYQPKSQAAKHFTVAIDDKSGRTAVVERR